jgi:hypothetical protein
VQNFLITIYVLQKFHKAQTDPATTFPFLAQINDKFAGWKRLLSLPCLLSAKFYTFAAGILMVLCTLIMLQISCLN